MIDKFLRDEAGWSQLQIEFNRAMNAMLMRDPRLTDWEKQFLKSLSGKCSDSGLLPKFLSEKQADTIESISMKVPDVPGL